MTRTPALLLAASLLLVAACGGGAASTPAAPADAPAATAAGSSDPGTTTGGGTATMPVDTPVSGTALTISGAGKSVSTPGACHISQLLGTDDYGVSFETDDDDFWLLSFDVRKFAGPGTYEIVDSEVVGKAFVSISDLVGGGSDSLAGTLTLGPGGTSGTVDAELEGSLGTMRVSGSFDCEML